LREHKPPILVVWGRNDPSFIAPGAEAFKRGLPDAEIHLLDAGHFALDEKNDDIASLVLASWPNIPPRAALQRWRGHDDKSKATLTGPPRNRL